MEPTYVYETKVVIRIHADDLEESRRLLLTMLRRIEGIVEFPMKFKREHLIGVYRMPEKVEEDIIKHSRR